MGRRRVTGQKKSLTTLKKKNSSESSVNENNGDVVVIDDDNPKTPCKPVPAPKPRIDEKDANGDKSPFIAPGPSTATSSNTLPQLDESPVKLDPDDFLLSQRSEHDFEVGWNSSSPRVPLSSGVDITDVIRKHASRHPKMKIANMGSPGLTNLWGMTSPVSQQRSAGGGGQRNGVRKSRPAKKSAISKDLLLKLAAAASKNSGVSAAVQVPAAATTPRRSSRLNLSVKKEHLDQSAMVLFADSEDGKEGATTPKFRSSTPVPAQNLSETPKSHKSINNSMDELWTDEEFDSDSFLAATQDMFTSTASPVFQGNKRRKDSDPDQPPQSKTGKFCVVKDLSPKPKPQWIMDNLVKKPPTSFMDKTITTDPKLDSQAQNSSTRPTANSSSIKSGNGATGPAYSDTNSKYSAPSKNSGLSNTNNAKAAVSKAVSKQSSVNVNSTKPQDSISSAKPFTSYSTSKSTSNLGSKPSPFPPVSSRTSVTKPASKPGSKPSPFRPVPSSTSVVSKPVSKPSPFRPVPPSTSGVTKPASKPVSKPSPFRPVPSSTSVVSKPVSKPSPFQRVPPSTSGVTKPTSKPVSKTSPFPPVSSGTSLPTKTVCTPTTRASTTGRNTPQPKTSGTSNSALPSKATNIPVTKTNSSGISSPKTTMTVAPNSISMEFDMDANSSISEDILAALAEPDDAFDSQVCMFDTTMQEQKEVLVQSDSTSQAKLQTAKDVKLNDKQMHEGDGLDDVMDDDSDPVPEDALLALLEAAESQASQSEVLAAKSCTLAVMDPSQLTLDIGSTFRPPVHSTQKLMPPPLAKITLPSSNIGTSSTNCVQQSESSSTLATKKDTAKSSSGLSNTKPHSAPSNTGMNKGAPKTNCKTITASTSKEVLRSSVLMNNSKPNHPMATTHCTGNKPTVDVHRPTSETTKSSPETVSASQVCSRDQIEQKRLEALKKRKNRLKLQANNS